MMPVEEFAAVVAKTVPTLKMISRAPRWQGLCPFHTERTPSFQVWYSTMLETPWYHCKGCGATGSAAKWMKLFHGQRVTFKPDPEILKERARGKRRERLVQSFYNVYPDACPEWDFILRGLVR